MPALRVITPPNRRVLRILQPLQPASGRLHVEIPPPIYHRSIHALFTTTVPCIVAQHIFSIRSLISQNYLRRQVSLMVWSSGLFKARACSMQSGILSLRHLRCVPACTGCRLRSSARRSTRHTRSSTQLRSRHFPTLLVFHACRAWRPYPASAILRLPLFCWVPWWPLPSAAAVPCLDRCTLSQLPAGQTADQGTGRARGAGGSTEAGREVPYPRHVCC